MCWMPILVIGCEYVMDGERLARWECKMLELKDTKIYPGIFHSVYMYIYILDLNVILQL
jgi:hypothetical protein